MKASDLTKRQQAVLRFIQHFVTEEGRSPTLTEIAKGVGSSAVSTIHKHTQHLIDKGFLKRSHGKGNNLVLTEAAGPLLAAAEEGGDRKEGKAARFESEARSEGRPEARDVQELRGRDAHREGVQRLIPFCGDVAAGTPILPESRAIPIEVPNAIHRQRDELFVLRVRGESMVDDAILDGDLVVLQRRAEYRNGERVVALIDGEDVTLKEFRRDAKGIWLIPHNPDLQPRLYAPERVEIQGVLVGVMRAC